MSNCCFFIGNNFSNDKFLEFVEKSSYEDIKNKINEAVNDDKNNKDTNLSLIKAYEDEYVANINISSSYISMVSSVLTLMAIGCSIFLNSELYNNRIIASGILLIGAIVIFYIKKKLKEGKDKKIIFAYSYLGSIMRFRIENNDINKRLPSPEDKIKMSDVEKFINKSKGKKKV
ncbi:hypothetical protein KQI68_10140 [Peptoniphilus sp. MSJ-1]|uniref:Uncharacterized protein n=1 Tax=Peptoniphilus ovalis TaxID=2841503 RepID=A0ABS6FJL0_9FIRM|nr:hypothetical protein [Peptoniphilus ovalis]MBU5670189.1 hypothetical protein [Peptoniphilus ovalis]